MEKVRIGIIGCGGIANGKHMPSLKKIEEAQMVAFCDIVEEKAVKAKEDYGTEGAKIYTDYNELLKDDSIDAVHICTPNRSHSNITVAALEAGKHVMCEKPMAINYSEAIKMVEAAKKTGKLLTIGYQNRFRPDSRFLKAECGKGTLGEVYFAKARALRRRAVPTWGVFLNEYEQGGGPLIDIGTHALDLTLWMMDNYKPKYAVGTTYHKLNKQTETGNAWGDWKSDEFTVEDSAFGFVVMENGATIIVESSWALNTLEVGEAQTILCGDKGGADMFDGLRINGVTNGRQYMLKPEFSSSGVAFYNGASDDAGVEEANTFVRAVMGKGELVVYPEQAAAVTQILDAIYQSQQTGQPVYFD
ncbi:MAG: oxidoreductase domain protein [Oscillospiraceae bacterium]|jgi:predicted dehydrogenase|nr:oxidoreductase domain protein [Oscillospiraceae bacterium]